jgi:hypothetical protein
MNDVAIIFIYGQKNHITSMNYQSIIQHSAGCDVYTSNQYDYPNHYYDFLNRLHISEWNKEQIWWSCDNLFLYWYLANPDKHYKQYIIIEDDTYANQNILDFLQIDRDWINNHNGIASAKTKKYADDKDYHWFKQFSTNPVIKDVYTLENLASCSPICCTILSNDAVQSIVEEMKKHPLINTVFSEIKYASILNYLQKYQLSNLNNKVSEYITYDETLCLQSIENYADIGNLSGVFHPIKNINTLHQYFLNKFKADNNYTQALLGISLDAMPFIEKAYKTGQNNVTVDNNLCGDPAPGVAKKLRIIYEKNNVQYIKYYDENSTLDLRDL